MKTYQTKTQLSQQLRIFSKLVVALSAAWLVTACGASKKSSSTTPGATTGQPTVNQGSCSNCGLTQEKLAVLGQAPGTELTLKIMSSTNLYPNYTDEKVEASGQIILQQPRGGIPAGTYTVAKVLQAGIMNGRFIGKTTEPSICGYAQSMGNNLIVQFVSGDKTFNAVFGVGGCGSSTIDVGMFIMHQTRVASGQSFRYILQGPVVLQNYNNSTTIQSIIDLN